MAELLQKNRYHLVLSGCKAKTVVWSRLTEGLRKGENMQINSSVNARYYTQYQSNTNVKYCAGFTKKEDGGLTPNETTKNPSFAEFVNYQEFHKAWMSQGAKTAFSYTKNEGFNAKENSEQAFEMDTSEPFTINNNDQIRLESDQNVKTDYQTKSDKKKSEIDFSRFAPNAPDEVRQAFIEASNETGYDETGKMDYISQILIKRVENTYNGVANPNDIFGNTVESALQAAKQMLYDLENPLSQRGENVAKYIEQEKEFYRTFIQKLEIVSLG